MGVCRVAQGQSIDTPTAASYYGESTHVVGTLLMTTPHNSRFRVEGAIITETIGVLKRGIIARLSFSRAEEPRNKKRKVWGVSSSQSSPSNHEHAVMCSIGQLPRQLNGSLPDKTVPALRSLKNNGRRDVDPPGASDLRIDFPSRHSPHWGGPSSELTEYTVPPRHRVRLEETEDARWIMTSSRAVSQAQKDRPMGDSRTGIPRRNRPTDF